MKKLGFLMLAIALMLGGTAFAQGDNSVYFVTYYSNAHTTGAPDATVRVINDGNWSQVNPLYASFYVFDDSQELTQCCSCATTADGITSESVNNELTAYPLRNIYNSRGVIKVISSTVYAAGPVGGNFTNKLQTGLRGWATHIQRANAAYAVTETPLADANLSASEESLLESLCMFDLMLSGSNCRCTPEDYDF